MHKSYRIYTITEPFSVVPPGSPCNQNLRQIGQGVYCYDLTQKQTKTDKNCYQFLFFVHPIPKNLALEVSNDLKIYFLLSIFINWICYVSKFKALHFLNHIEEHNQSIV